MERKNIGAPSAEQIDEAIKELWLKILQMSITEETTNIRPEIGDYINLIVPQLRVTYPMFYTPNLIATTYYSALETARRGVGYFFNEMGFDIKEYQKFPSWSKTVAYDAFEILKNLINDPAYKKLNRGDIKLLDVDPRRKAFLVEVKECGECWGLQNLKLRACHYSSGTIAGAWSSMTGIEFGVYEKNCIACGDNSCVYVIEPVTHVEHFDNVNEYINMNPREMYHAEEVVNLLRQHFIDGLKGKLKRPKYGDVLHLTDYQLRLLNTLSKHPAAYGLTHYHAGFRFGRYLSHFLKDYYGTWEKELFETALSDYYKVLGFAKVTSVESTKNGFKITMKEVADCAGLSDGLAPHNFLCGELTGVASEILGQSAWCINTKCRAGGDQICEFDITRK